MLMYFWLWLGCSAYMFLAVTELQCLCILAVTELQCLCILAVTELQCLCIFGCGWAAVLIYFWL